MPTVSLSVVVPSNADVVWSSVCSPAGFRFVSRGLVTWAAASQRDEPWREGETVSGWMYAGGVIPVAFHTLTFVRLDDRTREFRTDEHGGIITSWRHSITVTPIDAAQCRIDDSVVFSGGWMTPVLELAVRLFYIIRKPRWVGLARALASGRLRV